MRVYNNDEVSFLEWLREEYSITPEKLRDIIMDDAESEEEDFDAEIEHYRYEFICYCEENDLNPCFDY